VTAVGDRLDENGKMSTEELELWMRDPVECIKELMSNPAFKDHMVYAPERVYSRKDGKESSRIMDEMWTANWWWKLQVRNSFNKLGMILIQFAETFTARCLY
jgi:hypothetical protein